MFENNPFKMLFGGQDIGRTNNVKVFGRKKQPLKKQKNNNLNDIMRIMQCFYCFL